MAQNLGNNRGIDQETDSGPPGAMEGTNSGVLARSGGAAWARQQGATALKEQQDTDLGIVKDQAAKFDSGGIDGDTFGKT